MDIRAEIKKCIETRSKDLFLTITSGESIPWALCELTWLEFLELDIIIGSQATLPKEIGRLTRLKELYVIGGEFETLPESICDLKSLTTIKVTGSFLRRLPENIGRLKNLTHVSFFNTLLKEIPESVGELQNLKELELNWCRLISLPASMGKLSNLVSIGLSDNQLTAIPEEFCNLQQLKKLYLGGNKLDEIPECIKTLPDSMERHTLWVLKNYETLLKTFPVLNEKNEKQPDLDKKALQIYDMAIFNQGMLSYKQRKVLNNFLNDHLMPENEEISHVMEKYFGTERRFSIDEGAAFLQNLLFEEPGKITADEKETIVSFFESRCGYWNSLARSLEDFIRRYRAEEVTRFTYQTSFNHSIVCFDVSRSFSTRPHITRCPVCTSDIAVVERKFSTAAGEEFQKDASIANVETKLCVCPVCRWWAVSELHQDAEVYGMYDAICTCGVKTDAVNSEEDIHKNIQKMYNDTSHPWSPVFREQQYWNTGTIMTKKEALWLYGEEEAREK